MAKQMLTKWVKTAYPYLKDGCGVPTWVLPEQSLNRAMDEVGDSGLLKVSQPLGMSDSVRWLLESQPDPASVSPQEWQRGIKEWPYRPQFGPVVTAFVEVAEPIMAQFEKLRSAIDPMAICRSLAVLLYAPLVDQGKLVSAELADVLGGQANQPANLIASYAAAVARGDIPTLEKVNGCMLKYSDWQEWALALQKEVLRCRLRPKLIAVTPPLSAELTGVLAMMIKEESHESRGDHSARSGDQILAQ